MDLIRLASTQSCSRQMVKDILRTRFHHLIRVFVGLDVLVFSELLRQSNGVVYGSAALWMFKTPCSWSPNDINLLLPLNNTQPLSLFLISQGFSLLHSHVMAPAHFPSNQHAHTIKIFNHSVTHKRITITVSNSHSVFPLLLQPLDTLLMSFFTADGLVCFYPIQLFTNVRICGSRQESNRRVDKANRLGFRSEMSTADWDGNCGVCCPIMIRRVCGLRGAARFDWGPGPVIGSEDKMLKFADVNHFKWRLGDICLNKNCAFYYKG